MAHRVAQRLENSTQLWLILSQVYKFYDIHPKGKGEQVFCSGFIQLDSGNIDNAYPLFIRALSDDPGSLHKQIFVSWTAFLKDRKVADRSYEEINLTQSCRPGFALTEVFMIALLIELQRHNEAIERFDLLLTTITPPPKLNALYKIMKSKKFIPVHTLHRFI